MVVPSEMNAEIFDLVMEKRDFKTCALETSPDHGENNKSVEAESTEVVVTEEDTENSDNLNSVKDSLTNTNRTVPVIIEDLRVVEDAKVVVESQSFLSLSQSESSVDGVLDESISAGHEETKDISFDILESDRHLSTNSIDYKDTFETKSVDTVDSSLFENTQEPLELGCDESHDISRDVFDIVDDCHRGGVNVLSEESPAVHELPQDHSPPRLQATLSPLLASTPYSLPPMPRTRVSSTPCAPPSPLNSPYLSAPTPLDNTDGPMSLPTMSHSGSKSYDYLLKVGQVQPTLSLVLIIW